MGRLLLHSSWKQGDVIEGDAQGDAPSWWLGLWISKTDNLGNGDIWLCAAMTRAFLLPPPFIQNHCRITNMISSEITACFLYFFQEAVCLFWMSNNVLVLSQVSLSLNNLSSHRFWACNMATKMYLNGLLTERLFWNLRYNKLVSLCRERYTVVSAQRAEALFISQMGYWLMRLKSTKWIFTL